tara:strand:- start:150 stop:1958 length:1809 start_codon:yes stop_codon:yes gene_type:complete
MANETVTVTQSVNNVHVVTSGATGLNAGGDIDGNLSITPIWNESGTEFTSLLVNVTDTSSSSTSELLDMQIGGVSKFAVDKAGDTVAKGGLTVGANAAGSDVLLYGATDSRSARWDASDDSLELTDNVKLKIGTGDDLQLYHNASHSYVEATTGNLYIGNNTDDGDIIFQSDNGSGGVAEYFRVDGGDTNLVFSKALKLNSVNIDANSNKVTNLANGSASGDAVNVSQLDTKQATITGAATTIDTEDLTASRAVVSNSSGKIAVSDVTSTELGYLDGVSSAIQTQLDAKQATITGAATTIDTEDLTASRALASNGSGKIEVSAVTSTELGYLDGVTSAIQTQLDAKQAQPSEGAFANGDKTKLDAIESGADVTDATNVTAAGALMDSELTDLAGVKGVTISTLQVKPSEGAFADGDKTKLDAIEASADVTDATNVSAAGALMKSGGSMSGTLDFGSEAMSNGIWSGGALGGNLQGGGYKITGMAAGTANGDSLRWEQLRTIKNDQTNTTYTLVVGDATKTVRLNNASTVTVTVPDNTFEPGDVVTLFRKGAGGVTIDEASGVTINSVGDKKKLAYQYSAATLICITKGSGASEFDLIGDLTT